jgi:hypothetical protein
MLQRIQVKIEGKTPMLQNRMTEDQLEQLRTKVKPAKAKGNPATPRQQAAAHVYTMKDGTPYVPTENLMSCLIAAGVFIRLDGKRQMSTGKATVVPGLFEIEDAVLPIEGDPWEPDVRQGRNPNGGEAVCIVRPRFDRWALSFTIEVDLDEIDESKIRDLFDKAGSRVGLGDFRPARKGTFGKFRVVTWERLERSDQKAA